jgi:hypothetical protein
MKKHRYIGLDVHKESISIAVAKAGRTTMIPHMETTALSRLTSTQPYQRDESERRPPGARSA